MEKASFKRVGLKLCPTNTLGEPAIVGRALAFIVMNSVPRTQGLCDYFLAHSPLRLRGDPPCSECHAEAEFGHEKSRELSRRESVPTHLRQPAGSECPGTEKLKLYVRGVIQSRR